jgi:poly-gamma-glutamate synthesis protein (capsule biosynthesis protein)
MPDQIAVARSLSDAGADLIVGHHPHVVQQITRINGVPVFFSLGNLIFDSPRPEAQRTCLLEVEVVNNRMNFILYPLKLVNGAPTKMSKDEMTGYQVHIESISPAVVLNPQGDYWRLEFRSDLEDAEALRQPE